MKKNLLLFCLLISFVMLGYPAVKDNLLEKKFINISDGWYEATIRYFNSSTGTRSTYTLNVKVQYNRVVVIDFGNEGSVHSGFNNSGYIYSGGLLSFQRDYSSGNITTATARVTITEGSTMSTFNTSLN